MKWLARMGISNRSAPTASAIACAARLVCPLAEKYATKVFWLIENAPFPSRPTRYFVRVPWPIAMRPETAPIF